MIAGIDWAWVAFVGFIISLLAMTIAVFILWHDREPPGPPSGARCTPLCPGYGTSDLFFDQVAGATDVLDAQRVILCPYHRYRYKNVAHARLYGGRVPPR